VTGFLLDTNVPSELTRSKPDPQVEKWLEEADDEDLHISVITLGEIVKGIHVSLKASGTGGYSTGWTWNSDRGLKVAYCR